MDPTATDRESVVGDECHIESPSVDGPRGGGASGDPDAYDNLILLCKVDHKRVDDQPREFPLETLRALKTAHETWVEISLSLTPPDSRKVKAEEGTTRVTRLTDGAGLLDLVGGCDGYDFTHDPLEDETEVALVAAFLDKLHGYGEIFDELEPGERVRVRHELGKDLTELLIAGFVVYGGKSDRRVSVGATHHLARVATLRVSSLTNPAIWDPKTYPRLNEEFAAWRAEEANDE